MTTANADTLPPPAPALTRSMREIMALRDEYQERLRQHPFYEWIRDPAVDLADKLMFMPAMTLFVMNFRDMNLWVIRFEEDDGDVLKQIINGSTTEDETHSRLFLEDWRKLHFDDHLGWRPSDVLWWLFLSEEMEDFRRMGVEFMRLSADDADDPLVRFAHSEAGEACGHVFFEHISPLAQKLGDERGLDYRYFGMFHLELETGHVLESEDVFQDQPLSEDQYERGVTLAKRMFGIFDVIHDAFYQYVERYVRTGTTPKRGATVRYVDESNDSRGPAAVPSAGHTEVHESQRALQEHLETRASRAADHGFYRWLRSSKLPPVERIQRFLPLWAFDMLGYRDLNKYVFKFTPPRNELERSVNVIASDLESHSQLFLQDWSALGLDEMLRWPASDTLDFLFLDYFMDRHRKNLITFGMLGLRHRTALERLWLMEALEKSGHAFFENTRVIALEAEKQSGIRLDYLADRHATVHESERGEVENFKMVRMPRGMEQHAHGFIDTVFDALERNLAMSLDAVRENKLAVRPSHLRLKATADPASAVAAKEEAS